MISRAQQILIKRAQHEAGLDDEDYRSAMQAATGCRSSTDPEMTDRAVDLVLAYLEAIHWRNVDAGLLQPSCKPNAVFRQRGYWARKNPCRETSRDRYVANSASQAIQGLEAELMALGFNEAYCQAIRRNVTHGRQDAHALAVYQAALARTLKGKRGRMDRDPAVETTEMDPDGCPPT